MVFVPKTWVNGNIFNAAEANRMEAGIVEGITSGGGGTGGVVDWTAITNKPSTFPPVIGSTSVVAKRGDWFPTKAEVGLGNVDNTADNVKPISLSTQTALTSLSVKDTQTSVLIAQLTERVAALEGSEPPPVTSTLEVGARVKERDATPDNPITVAEMLGWYVDASAAYGPLHSTRVFETLLPTTHVPITPAGSIEVVSYKSATQSRINSFHDTMRPGTRVAFHHEPEGFSSGTTPEYATGALFVNAFNAQAEMWGNAGGSLGMISGGYQWRPVGRGRDGSFLPPPSTCAWYSFDSYMDATSNDGGYGTIEPLENHDWFQAWLSFVADRGRPLGITEYGRGIVGMNEMADTPARRAAVFPQDGDYLRSLNFFCWIYFHSNFGPDGRYWKFTDTASKNAWKHECLHA